MQFCQRIEYEVADYIYETRNSLVEICREEPASSIVILDTAVPFYQATRVTPQKTAVLIAVAVRTSKLLIQLVLYFEIQ
jgi:hypothetical protein